MAAPGKRVLLSFVVFDGERGHPLARLSRREVEDPRSFIAEYVKQAVDSIHILTHSLRNLPDTIFKATYSSVPVYEMPCKGVAVMKRRADGWLNATQVRLQGHRIHCSPLTLIYRLSRPLADPQSRWIR